MLRIKAIIAKIYFFYFKFFPIDRGKNFSARVLNAMLGKFQLRTSSGVTIKVDLFSPSEIKYFIHKEEYLEVELKKLKEGDTFVDIGANIGYYSLLASKSVVQKGRVYSFEPSQREYMKFLTNIQINNISNIIPVNSAVGKESSLIELEIKKYHTGGNSIVRDELSPSNKITVRQTTLDQFIKEYKITEIELLKIDVEGFEFNVLNGLKESLSNRIVKRIFIEITPRFLKSFDHSVENIYSYLQDAGFYPEKGINDARQYDELFILKSSSKSNQ